MGLDPELVAYTETAPEPADEETFESYAPAIVVEDLDTEEVTITISD